MYITNYFEKIKFVDVQKTFPRKCISSKFPNIQYEVQHQHYCSIEAILA